MIKKQERQGVMTQLSDRPAKLVRIIDDPRASSARIGRRLAGALALICFMVIILASFYPFVPIHNPAAYAGRLQNFLHSLSLDPANLECLKPGHLCLNFFFYFPLGVLLAMTFRPWLTGAGVRLLYAAALGLGPVMSLAIEFLQIGFSDRDPDLSDTVMNTLGYWAGLGLLRWLIRSGRLDLATLPIVSQIRDRQGLARLLGAAYCLLLLAASLLRVVFLSSRRGFQGLPYRDISGLALEAWRDPLDSWTMQRMLIVAGAGLCFVPVGFLFRAGQYFWGHRRFLTCALFATMLAAVLEFVRTVPPDKPFDPARIISSALGAMAGAGLAGWRRQR